MTSNLEKQNEHTLHLKVLYLLRFVEVLDT